MYFSVVFKILDFWKAIYVHFNKKNLYEDVKYSDYLSEYIVCIKMSGLTRSRKWKEKKLMN